MNVIVSTSQTGAPGRIRTCSRRLRRPVLYPLSHGRHDYGRNGAAGRGREIRTPDFLLPKQARCQTAPCPENADYTLRSTRRHRVRPAIAPPPIPLARSAPAAPASRSLAISLPPALSASALAHPQGAAKGAQRLSAGCGRPAIREIDKLAQRRDLACFPPISNAARPKIKRLATLPRAAVGAAHQAPGPRHSLAGTGPP